MICICRGRFEYIPCQMTQMSQTHLGSLGSCLRAVLRSAWSESTSYAALTCSPKTTMAWWLCSWFTTKTKDFDGSQSITFYIFWLAHFWCVSCTYPFFLKCDPYIKISLGKKIIDDRDHYKPNTLNPDFGRWEYKYWSIYMHLIFPLF